MTLFLYDTQTETLLPYPRADDDPVVGLDPRYAILRLLQDEQPAYDPQTQRLDSTQLIDLEAGEVRRGWVVVTLPPPVPVPDFKQLRDAIRTENGFFAALMAVYDADRVTAPTLVSRLDLFQKDGDFTLFLESLQAALAVLPPQEAAHVGLEFLALSVRCNMPAPFLAALEDLFEELPPTP